ncbi:hypothetical protein NHX12_017850 [Muraenolepis orangiensis]|uniref:Uncharacterized protein n=1 Tax=Muraenolepis orangiensis TaxID=630683 RepID=A0A9Q0IYE7_9TELE|nr:hypothetical protein NHX12_017850 [Muraenolepis orangiensis]
MTVMLQSGRCAATPEAQPTSAPACRVTMEMDGSVRIWMSASTVLVMVMRSVSIPRDPTPVSAALVSMVMVSTVALFLQPLASRPAGNFDLRPQLEASSLDGVEGSTMGPSTTESSIVGPSTVEPSTVGPS